MENYHSAKDKEETNLKPPVIIGFNFYLIARPLRKSYLSLSFSRLFLYFKAWTCSGGGWRLTPATLLTWNIEKTLSICRLPRLASRAFVSATEIVWNWCLADCLPLLRYLPATNAVPFQHVQYVYYGNLIADRHWWRNAGRRISDDFF